MFKLSEIKELMKLLDQTSIHELELENEGTKLVLRKPNKTETVVVAAQAPALTSSFVPQAPLPVAAIPPAPVQLAGPTSTPAASVPAQPVAAAGVGANENLHKISSPMVGTFYPKPNPDSPSFVSVGDKVTAKTVVCIVEAMKLMNEIEAEVEGTVVEVLVKEGELVEYGQPLFLVRK
jgi:acetyl-CoA carboxylase biotin carboxyl carrier protein